MRFENVPNGGSRGCRQLAVDRLAHHRIDIPTHWRGDLRMDGANCLRPQVFIIIVERSSVVPKSEDGSAIAGGSAVAAAEKQLEQLRASVAAQGGERNHAGTTFPSSCTVSLPCA